MATYKSVVLAKRPVGPIVAGETFRLEEKPLLTASDLKNAQVLLEPIYLSLDPAMRGMLMDVRSYVPPVQIDARMQGMVLAKVTASKSAKYEVGAFVTARSGWTEQEIVDDSNPGVSPLDVPQGCRLTDTLGALGMTGLTAYFGLLDIGKVKAGDFVVVSGAAGATGSIVVQIAKLKGAKVLALAGSDDKVAWLKELGCDEALNYKNANFAADFKAATADLIDVFFDNVGGEILDLALGQAKQGARFVMCGGISQYNDVKPQGITNIIMVVKMRIRMEGFIVFDFLPRFGEGRAQLAQWLQEGKIQRKETIIPGGLEAAEKGLIDLYAGINTGKLLVQIRKE